MSKVEADKAEVLTLGDHEVRITHPEALLHQAGDHIQA